MTSGLRAHKKLGTRRALAETALVLATEHGYHQVTVLDITTAVGVSRRTFSNYFPGKAECLVAVVDGWLEELLQAFTDDLRESSLPDLMSSALQAAGRQLADQGGGFFELLRTEPELQAAAAAQDAGHLNLIAAALARRSGLQPDDLRVELLARFYFIAGRTSVDRWVNSGRVGGSAGLTRLLDSAFSILDLRWLTDRRMHG